MIAGVGSIVFAVATVAVAADAWEHGDRTDSVMFLSVALFALCALAAA